MSLPAEDVRAQQTYRAESGRLWYVQDISGEMVTWNEVGSLARHTISLSQFASRLKRSVPNA